LTGLRTLKIATPWELKGCLYRCDDHLEWEGKGNMRRYGKRDTEPGVKKVKKMLDGFLSALPLLETLELYGAPACFRKERFAVWCSYRHYGSRERVLEQVFGEDGEDIADMEDDIDEMTEAFKVVLEAELTGQTVEELMGSE